MLLGFPSHWQKTFLGDLNLQQKLERLLHSSQQQMSMRSFRGIYSFFLWYRSSFLWISVMSNFMQVYFSDIYIFLRDHVATLENIVWLLIWLAARKLHFYSNRIGYFIEQTSTIHSADAGFPNNTKYCSLILYVSIGWWWTARRQVLHNKAFSQQPQVSANHMK